MSMEYFSTVFFASKGAMIGPHIHETFFVRYELHKNVSFWFCSKKIFKKIDQNTELRIPLFQKVIFTKKVKYKYFLKFC